MKSKVVNENLAVGGRSIRATVELKEKEYTIYYSVQLGGYTVRGKGEYIGTIAPDIFDTLDQAKEHAELEIGGLRDLNAIGDEPVDEGRDFRPAVGDILWKRLDKSYPKLESYYGFEIVGDAILDIANSYSGDIEDISHQAITNMVHAVVDQLKSNYPIDKVDEGYGPGRRPATPKGHMKAKWMRSFEEQVLHFNPNLAGKIEWDSANYFYNSNIDPQEAAQKYVSARAETIGEDQVKWQKKKDLGRLLNPKKSKIDLEVDEDFDPISNAKQVTGPGEKSTIEENKSNKNYITEEEMQRYTTFLVCGKNGKKYGEFDTLSEANTFVKDTGKKLRVLEYFDIHAYQLDEIRKELLKNPALFENTADYSELTDFLSLHTTEEPIPGNSYVYASVYSVLPGRIINYSHFDAPAKFIGIEDDKAVFVIHGKNRPFPQGDSISGDLLKKSFVFESIDQAEEFQMLLTLQFGEWNYSHKPISVGKQIDEEGGRWELDRDNKWVEHPVSHHNALVAKNRQLQGEKPVFKKEKNVFKPEDDLDEMTLAQQTRLGKFKQPEQVKVGPKLPEKNPMPSSNAPMMYEMAKPVSIASQLKKAKEDGEFIGVDQISKDKEGNFIFRLGYFYRQGMDSTKFAQRVEDMLRKAGFNATLVDDGDHWAAFKGGASVKAQSHFWAKFSIQEQQAQTPHETGTDNPIDFPKQMGEDVRLDTVTPDGKMGQIPSKGEKEVNPFAAKLKAKDAAMREKMMKQFSNAKFSKVDESMSHLGSMRDSEIAAEMDEIEHTYEYDNCPPDIMAAYEELSAEQERRRTAKNAPVGFGESINTSKSKNKPVIEPGDISNKLKSNAKIPAHARMKTEPGDISNKLSKVKEAASAGSSCSSAIATGPASNVLQKPIKRVKETTSKYKNARPDAFSGSIGKGIYEAIENLDEAGEDILRAKSAEIQKRINAERGGRSQPAKQPRKTHTPDCEWHSGHDCDCGMSGRNHDINCGWNTGHDCDCGLKEGMNEAEPMCEGWKEKVGAAALAGSLAMGSSPANASIAGSFGSGLSQGLVATAGSAVLDKKRTDADKSFAELIPDAVDKTKYLKKLKYVLYFRSLRTVDAGQAIDAAFAEHRFKKFKQALAQKYHIETSIKEEAEPMSLNAGTNLDPDQFAEEVKKAWHQVMPNSAISARKILGGWTFRFFLVNGKDECANGILDNDPFYYSAHLTREGNFEEQHSSLLVKPTRPHMVYDSVHFRKQTMKAPSYDKLVKRFTKIREWIMSNAENLKDVKFDIDSKLHSLNINEDITSDHIEQHMAKRDYNVVSSKTIGDVTHIYVNNLPEVNGMVPEEEVYKAQSWLDKTGLKNYRINTRQRISSTGGGRFNDGGNED